MSLLASIVFHSNLISHVFGNKHEIYIGNAHCINLLVTMFGSFFLFVCCMEHATKIPHGDVADITPAKNGSCFQYQFKISVL
jgi:hypothetical protein